MHAEIKFRSLTSGFWPQILSADILLSVVIIQWSDLCDHYSIIILPLLKLNSFILSFKVNYKWFYDLQMVQQKARWIDLSSKNKKWKAFEWNSYFKILIPM